MTVTTCTPLPSKAFKYTGNVPTSVLPSPVFISEIRPSCRAIPPINCTSKCRIPSVRLEASRTVANASGRISSRVSPFSIRARNSAVLACNCSSDSFTNSGSNPLITSTVFMRRLTSRSLVSPNIFFTSPSMVNPFHATQMVEPSPSLNKN
ncbi:hypothetical protein D3C71_1684850 [compost metagenome]